MPIGPAYHGPAAEAIADMVPVDATVHLYSDLASSVTGPVDADELASTGGYAAADVPTLTLVGVEVTGDADFGTSSAAWPESALAWAIKDTGGDVVLFDRLTEPLVVSAASTVVTVPLSIFYRSAAQ